MDPVRRACLLRKKRPKEKGQDMETIVIVLLVILFLGGGGYWYRSRRA